MYVIQGSITTNTNAQGIPINTVTIFPAETCGWTQTYVDGQYSIEAFYIPSGGGDVTPIQDAALGYIGKSGRFVKIAD